MKNNVLLYTIVLSLSFLSCKKNIEQTKQGFTAINPLAYTDVVYNSVKDTVIVSTYSGRIAKRIKQQNNEEVIIQLNDEVYSLQYAYKEGLVIASTLKSGILFIDITTGKISKQINIGNGAWINSIILSSDERYLAGMDVKGNNHIWDLHNEYQPLDFSEELSKCYIRYIDESGLLFYQTKGRYIKWNPREKSVESELKVHGKLVDIDENGNLLLLNFNEFSYHNANLDSTIFKRKHPYYIYKYSNGDTTHDPFHLKLTSGVFTRDRIYTSSLDQSIRVWNKIDGSLVDEWYLHHATISEMDIARNQKQLVSVDLKGGIEFWDLK